jgi:hypothetical protein
MATFQCTPFIPKYVPSQTTLSLTKFIETYINIYNTNLVFVQYISNFPYFIDLKLWILKYIYLNPVTLREV